MNEIHSLHSLFVIAFIAVFAPLLGRLPALAQTPVVVLELVLGILIGPSCAGWASSEGSIGFFAEFGLIFLFFQAGFEFSRDEIGLASLRLGALAWFASLGLALVFTGPLYAAGFLHAPMLVALMLTTTAFGILVPILGQIGELESNFGRYVLGSAAIGELGPMVLASLALGQAHHHLRQTLSSMVLLAIAIGAIFFAKNLRSSELSRMIARWLGESSILPVRFSILILLGLISLANELGMELVLSAYTAGMVIAILLRGAKAQMLQDRLTSMGSGFFIPLFYITSGVQFDLSSLIASPASLVRFILVCAAFLFLRLFIRILPLRFYKTALPERDLVPLGLFSATTLPLVLAATYLGVRTGQMLPQNAAALIGAAVLSVAVFPRLGISLRSKSQDGRPIGVMAVTGLRFADLAAEELSRLCILIAHKIRRTQQ